MSNAITNPAGEGVIFRECNRESNVNSLQDLCQNCPIPGYIKVGLHEKQAEIDTRRQAEMPTGFRIYCEQQIAHFAKEAGEWARRLAAPAELQGGFIPARIEYKFFCLGVCDLYKKALESTPVAGAATPATVEQLCCNRFTPDDLIALLTRLGVVDDEGKCLTNDLKGKGRGKRGAFTAAYRVLHREGLLNPTKTDREWADTFKLAYGANLGDEVISHQLTPHGKAQTLAPGPFEKAVNDATAWVADWRAAIRH